MILNSSTVSVSRVLQVGDGNRGGFGIALHILFGPSQSNGLGQTTDFIEAQKGPRYGFPLAARLCRHIIRVLTGFVMDPLEWTMHQKIRPALRSARWHVIASLN